MDKYQKKAQAKLEAARAAGLAVTEGTVPKLFEALEEMAAVADDDEAAADPDVVMGSTPPAFACDACDSFV